jgi:tetratricopeptide (TPR) repeat protein
MNKILIILFFLFSVPSLFAQKANDDVRKGNGFYRSEQFTEAEVEYRKGLSKDSASSEGNYNLGNALYKQGKVGEANQSYLKTLNAEKSKQKNKFSQQEQAAVYHNIGNTLLVAKEYEKSVEAYKQALRLNPKDDETRYNLAYAQKFVKKQEKQPKQNKQQQEPKSQPQQPPPPENQKMNKDEAQRLLDAVLQNEKQAPKSVRHTTSQPEKDW